MLRRTQRRQAPWRASRRVLVLLRIMARGRVHERIAIEVQPDLHLRLFTAGVAVLTGLLFGLAPAWHTFRTAPASGLRQSGRSETRV